MVSSDSRLIVNAYVGIDMSSVLLTTHELNGQKTKHP